MSRIRGSTTSISCSSSISSSSICSSNQALQCGLLRRGESGPDLRLVAFIGNYRLVIIISRNSEFKLNGPAQSFRLVFNKSKTSFSKRWVMDLFLHEGKYDIRLSHKYLWFEIDISAYFDFSRMFIWWKIDFSPNFFFQNSRLVCLWCSRRKSTGIVTSIS